MTDEHETNGAEKEEGQAADYANAEEHEAKGAEKEEVQAGGDDDGEEMETKVKPAEILGKLFSQLVQEGDNHSAPNLEDYEREVGGAEPIVEPDVDIELHPSRNVPVAGELWSISGTISNRSAFPVWIINVTSSLTLAPEMYGLSSSTGSMGAFFPTIRNRSTTEVVRIDPGASYTVIWKIDPLATSQNDTNTLAALAETIQASMRAGEIQKSKARRPHIYKRIANSINNFLYFNPGEFRVSATCHIWTVRPQIVGDDVTPNTGRSFVKTVSKELYMDSSPWVLICGAMVGGVLCFILKLLYLLSGNGAGVGLGLSTVAEFASSLVLCSVATVLLSRLATTDFLLVVKIKDFWGAIATGFVVQWFGIPMLEKMMTAISTGGPS